MGRRVRVMCVLCACGVHAVRMHMQCTVHAPCSAQHPHTHARTHLRHVGELRARPVARVGQDVVEGLVAAVLKGVNVHRAHPRLVGGGGWREGLGLG